MRFRPAPLPQWEVIDLKEVAPTPVYYDNDEGKFIFSHIRVYRTAHRLSRSADLTRSRTRSHGHIHF